MNLDDFLARLEEVGTDHNGLHSARCPACNSKTLMVGVFDYKISVNCSVGCSEDEICTAMGITEDDLYIKAYSEFSMYFKPLSDFEEQEAKWLIKGWLPEGQITLLAGDGGLGKTTIWCNVAAALSNGTMSILDKEEVCRTPKKVLVLTTEDSISKTLKKKLRLAGANEKNITALDLQLDKDGEVLGCLTFGSKDLHNVIRTLHPDLCIFDPVQGFIPPDINMGSRNAMRNALAPLIPLGEECGTTFLIICHSNKRKGAAGRDRIADSADLWDIARSVLIVGYTQENDIRYLSNEKNNYAPLSDTVLFNVNKNGLIEKIGTTNKRDRDYVFAAMKYKDEEKAAPQRDGCKEFILDTLKECNGIISVKELEEKAKAFDYSVKTLRAAKEELKATGEIDITQQGSGRNGTKKWHVVYGEFFSDVTDEEITPWEQIEMDKKE